MANENRYFLKIYKGKELQDTCPLVKDAFERFHTALKELSKKEKDLKWSFGICEYDYNLEVDKEVLDKILEHTKQKFKQPTATATADAVNHPSHYTSDPSGVECIEVTKHRDFCIGNAIKYLWRAGLKQDADKTAKEKQIEDLKKAIWYINAEIDLLQNSQE